MSGATWHSCQIHFPIGDCEYKVDIRYETDVGSLTDWYLERIEVDLQDEKTLILDKSEIDSGRYATPENLRTRYRAQIEALILEEMPLPSPRKDSRHVI